MSRPKRTIWASTVPRWTRRLIVSLAGVALAVVVVRAFLFEPHRIASGSMTPTLHTGDLVLADRFSYGIRIPLTDTLVWGSSMPARGDVVILHRPTISEKPEVTYVKRVIGLPGERVRLDANRLYIDGASLPTRILGNVDCQDLDRPDCLCERQAERIGGLEVVTQHFSPPPKNTSIHCVNHDEWPLADDPDSARPEVLVPEGHLLCLGDNRDNSSDGRSWGFVPQQNVTGRVRLRVWPPSRAPENIR